MIIKLNKNQWKEIGKKAGWMEMSEPASKYPRDSRYIIRLYFRDGKIEDEPEWWGNGQNLMDAFNHLDFIALHNDGKYKRIELINKESGKTEAFYDFKESN